MMTEAEHPDFQIEAPPPRMNGPALWMLVNPDGPERHEPTICVGPTKGYNEAILQFDWKMVDPTTKAYVELWQTLDSDWTFPTTDNPLAGMTPLPLDARDKDRSTWIVDPSEASAENQIRLVFPRLAASHIAFRWTTMPRNAPAMARAWVLLTLRSHLRLPTADSPEPEERGECEVCGSPTGKLHNGAFHAPELAYFACCHSPASEHPYSRPCCAYFEEAFYKLSCDVNRWAEAMLLARKQREADLEMHARSSTRKV